MLCKPVWTEQAWFTREKLQDVVNPGLEQKKEQNEDYYVVMGWDIGKKVHPSHVVIFEEKGSGHWVQIYQRFLDGWNYNKQLGHINELVRKFKVDEGAYDATRGEMASFVERGELSNVL